MSFVKGCCEWRVLAAQQQTSRQSTIKKNGFSRRDEKEFVLDSRVRRFSETIGYRSIVLERGER